MKNFLNKIFIFMGLAPTENDKIINNLVKNSYKSVRVVGRGTVIVDPEEVRANPQFKEDLQKAKEIVENSNRV